MGESLGEGITLHAGDCRDVMAAMETASIDAVVTDPPYGLADLKPKVVIKALTEWLTGDRWFVPDGRGFMSREWDKFVPPPAAWDECYRVMRPGAYLLAFAAPRTADLMGTSIRLAGFEVHDSLHWVSGQGFPKAKSRLKPAHEPVIMARKPARSNPPLPGLNGCKVTHASDADRAESEGKNRHADFGSGPRGHNGVYAGMPAEDRAQYDGSAGRWPPNILLTHSADCRPAGTRDVASNARARKMLAGTDKFPGAYGDLVNDVDRAYGEPGHPETVTVWDCAPGCPVAGLDTQSGTNTNTRHMSYKRSGGEFIDGIPSQPEKDWFVTETGGASRFFPALNWDADTDLPFLYCAKAPKSERPRLPDGTAWPTVKPLTVMRWLVRLVTPPGGTVLDPFAGSGTTGHACALEGFSCILIERDPAAAELTRVRMSAPMQGELTGGVA